MCVCVYIMYDTDHYFKNGEEKIKCSLFWFCSLFRYPGVSHILNNFSLLDMSLYIACCFQGHKCCLENNFPIKGCMVPFPDCPNHKSMGIFDFYFRALEILPCTTQNKCCDVKSSLSAC